MKKKVIAILGVILCLVGTYYGYNYYNGPKIIDGVISKGINGKGNPVEFTTELSPEDTVYFSAKANRFWVKKAKVVWYKDKLATENRFLVEEDIVKNEAGYFTAELTARESLEEGHYVVTIYEDGNDIRETTAEFYVKK